MPHIRVSDSELLWIRRFAAENGPAWLLAAANLEHTEDERAGRQTPPVGGMHEHHRTEGDGPA